MQLRSTTPVVITRSRPTPNFVFGVPCSTSCAVSIGCRASDGETLNLLDLVSTDETQGPAQLVQARRLKELIAEAVDDLPYQEKVVISLYYYEELTMKEIGKVLDITESRVSQIHTKSIFHLRSKLKLLLQDDLIEGH